MNSKLNQQDVRILVIDDDPHSLKIMSKALEWEKFNVQGISDPVLALRLVNEFQPHLILLDVNMPELNGLELLRRVRQRDEYIATIFVSGQSEVDDVVQGLNAGADDYICKPFHPQDLVARVKSQLRNKLIHDELRAANKKLKELVDIDDLTGLYNMRSVYQKLESEIERARRYKRSVCAVMVDLDHFKRVNDCNDHLFGSHVLAQLGSIIKNTIRMVDFAARYGGDEFIIILSEIDSKGAASFCERLRKSIEEYHFQDGENQINITASIGYAITKKGQTDIDGRNLVRTADVALYEAKDSGRNCIKYFDYGDAVKEAEIYTLRKKSSK